MAGAVPGHSKYFAMAALDYSSTSSTRLRWFGWPTILAGALLAHFAISTAVWILWFGGMLANPDMRDAFLPSLPEAAPAFVLCALCAALFVLALRGRALARRGAVFAAVASAAFFWTDVSFQRYQISVDIATKEYWDGGGKAHAYFTWWWYNDRWFR